MRALFREGGQMVWTVKVKRNYNILSGLMAIFFIEMPMYFSGIPTMCRMFFRRYCSNIWKRPLFFSWTIHHFWWVVQVLYFVPCQINTTSTWNNWSIHWGRKRTSENGYDKIVSHFYTTGIMTIKVWDDIVRYRERQTKQRLRERKSDEHNDS